MIRGFFRRCRAAAAAFATSPQRVSDRVEIVIDDKVIGEAVRRYHRRQS